MYRLHLLSMSLVAAFAAVPTPPWSTINVTSITPNTFPFSSPPPLHIEGTGFTTATNTTCSLSYTLSGATTKPNPPLVALRSEVLSHTRMLCVFPPIVWQPISEDGKHSMPFSQGLDTPLVLRIGDFVPSSDSDPLDSPWVLHTYSLFTASMHTRPLTSPSDAAVLVRTHPSLDDLPLTLHLTCGPDDLAPAPNPNPLNATLHFRGRHTHVLTLDTTSLPWPQGASRWDRYWQCVVHATLFRDATIAIQSTHFLLELAAGPRTNQVLVSGRHRSLVVDGAPFLPFGYFIADESMTDPDVEWSEQQLASAIRRLRLHAAQGVNHMMSYALCYNPHSPLDPRQRAVLLRYYNAAAELGVRIQMCAPGAAWLFDNSSMPQPLVDAFADFIDWLKDHPALLSWYIGEDTTGQDMLRFSRTRRFIRQIDPWHPISASVISGGRAWAYQYWVDFQQLEAYFPPAGVSLGAQEMASGNNDFLPLALAPGLGICRYSELDIALGAIYGISGFLFFLLRRGSPFVMLAKVNTYGRYLQEILPSVAREFEPGLPRLSVRVDMASLPPSARRQRALVARVLPPEKRSGCMHLIVANAMPVQIPHARFAVVSDIPVALGNVSSVPFELGRRVAIDPYGWMGDMFGPYETHFYRLGPRCSMQPPDTLRTTDRAALPRMGRVGGDVAPGAPPQRDVAGGSAALLRQRIAGYEGRGAPPPTGGAGGDAHHATAPKPQIADASFETRPHVPGFPNGQGWTMVCWSLAPLHPQGLGGEFDPDNGAILLDTRWTVTGRHSLRVAICTASLHTLGLWIPLTVGGGTRDCGTALPFPFGQQALVFFARSVHCGVRIHVVVVSARGGPGTATRIASTNNLTRSWSRFVLKFSLPKTMVAPQLVFTSSGSGLYWLDDVSWEQLQ